MSDSVRLAPTNLAVRYVRDGSGFITQIRYIDRQATAGADIKTVNITRDPISHKIMSMVSSHEQVDSSDLSIL